MKRAFRPDYLLLATALLALLPRASLAADADDSGFTFTSPAENVNHWGLGVGAGIRQSAYRGDGTRYSPIPLITFENKWVSAFGTQLDLKLGRWNNVSFALRASYGLADGYSASDAASLTGMATRKSAFWYGPAIAWKTGFGTLSAQTLLGGNKGQKAGVEFGKGFRFGRFSLTPHAGVEWRSQDNVDYYYGVRASEAEAGRPEYAGKSTVNVSAGARMDFAVTRHQRFTLDVGVTRLGSGITDSPIVGRTYVPQARIGYFYQFQ